MRLVKYKLQNYSKDMLLDCWIILPLNVVHNETLMAKIFAIDLFWVDAKQ